MTQRNYYDEGAGPWVAYIEGDRVDGKGQLRRFRSYPWGLPPWSGMTWTGSAEDSIRFDTKREALAAIRAAGRGRPHAHRIDTPPEQSP